MPAWGQLRVVSWPVRWFGIPYGVVHITYGTVHISGLTYGPYLRSKTKTKPRVRPELRKMEITAGKQIKIGPGFVKLS